MRLPLRLLRLLPSVICGQRSYLTSTVAPTSSSFFLPSSASALVAPFLIEAGALSTSSLASFRPSVPPVEFAHDFDNRNLLCAGFFEDDFKFGLFLCRGRCARRAASRQRLPSRALRPLPSALQH